MRARVFIARPSILQYTIASYHPTPSAAHQPNAPHAMPSNYHPAAPNAMHAPSTEPHNSNAGEVFPAPLCSGGNKRRKLQPRPIAHQRRAAAGRACHTKERRKCAFLQVMTENLQNNPIVVSFTGSNGNDTRRGMQDFCHGLQDTPHFTSPGAPKFPEQDIALPPAQAFHASTPQAKKNRSSIEKAPAIPALAQNPEGGWLLHGHIMKIIRRRLRPALSFYL